MGVNMEEKPETFYKYRAFNTAVLESLCHDTIYFSNPRVFNDPLDCNPTLESDSTIEELRRLLAFLVKKRVEAGALESLKQALMKGEDASRYAENMAKKKADDELSYIAYQAASPEYEVDIKEAERWILVTQIESELNQYYERGVSCFSITYSNALLWSHYGDQHQGICIGYGVERRPLPELSKVLYGGSRIIKTSQLINTFLMNNTEEKKKLERNILLRKAEDWDYEEEWRLIGKQGVQDSPLLLKEITFGLRCPNYIKHTVVKVLLGRSSKMQYFEMKTNRGSYELCREPLDVAELGVYLPQTARSGIEIFGSEIDEQ